MSEGALHAAPRWRGAPLVLLLIAVAWALAVGAELTGGVQWVHHHDLLAERLPFTASLGLFLIAWQVHVAAMMLPSALPMLAAFHRAAAGQPRPQLARGIFLGGYVAVWTGFGLVALVGQALVDGLLHDAVQRSGLLHGAVLVLAGTFQFSALKDRCLEQCRHPRAFLLQHYRRGALAALRLGVRHGLFCVGCCWALMLVMFVVGIANLAWMAPLALLMLYEKAGRHGRRIVRPVGVGLIGLGLAILAGVGPLEGVVPHHH